MAYFTLEALPARHGDCLMLHFGDEAAPGLVVIDGGPATVWKKALEPRLDSIRQDRPGGGAIDLLMVSHIDDDHIQGIVEFLGAWVAADEDGREWHYPVAELWHNSFERVTGADPKQVTASVLASTGAAALPDIELAPEEGEDEEAAERRIDAARAAVMILAGVAQGARVRRDSGKLGIPRNTGFDGLVRPGAGPQIPFEVGSELTFRVVGPLPDQLEKLRDKFAAELPPQEALAAYTDQSVNNLSSIVVLARFGDKTMLLTGDARGDYLLEGLAAEGLLQEGGLHVDILKMQHHGSDRNTRQDFFETVTADHYVASADGAHGNPDRDTFEMLIEARGQDARYTVHLTHPVAAIDAKRKEEWEKDRAADIRKGKKEVRAEWRPETDAIATLIAGKQAEGYRFEVSEPGGGRRWPRIDLLDPLPF
jgi:hypothetical protein